MNLTDADVEAARRAAVPDWVLERIDPRWGTVACVAYIKQSMQSWSRCGACEDGPYSDGENAEWWARCITRVPAGIDVRVVHEVRAGGSTVIREGRVAWNQIANMTTHAAIALRRSRSEVDPEPLPGQQTSLPV